MGEWGGEGGVNKSTGCGPSSIDGIKSRNEIGLSFRFKSFVEVVGFN